MSSIGQVIKTLRQDFARTGSFAGRVILVIVRLRAYVHHSSSLPVLKYLWWLPVSLGYLFICKFLYHCDISHSADIGPGLRLVHPYNIIIADGVRIGSNCKVLHEITIGYATRHGKTGVPTLGDEVQINAGAKVIGPIIVGDGVKIGVNSVVYKDVASYATVFSLVGVREVSSQEQ